MADMQRPDAALAVGADAMPELRRVMRAGLIALAIFAVLLIAWIVLAPLHGAVIASGQLRANAQRQTLQHQEGGIVAEVKVRDGDHVKAGQPLLVLEDVRVDASLDLLRSQYEVEQAREARLEAEKSLLDAVVFPPGLLAQAGSPRVAEVLEREQAVFAARRQALNGQIGLLLAQKRQTADEAAAWRQQIDAEARALGLQREELLANEELVRKNFVQKTRVLGLQRNVAEYEARLGEHRAELARTAQKASDIDLRILSLRNGYAQTAADELKDSSGKRIDLEEKLRPSSDAAARQVVSAPSDGVVVELKARHAGLAVGPREPLMDLVPDDALVVSARLRPEDVAHVQPGAAADVRLMAFNQRSMPMLKAVVRVVSADRIVERTRGIDYYEVTLDLDSASLRAAGSPPLRAGMPVEAYLLTAERSVFEYLFEPVTAYLNRGLREP